MVGSVYAGQGFEEGRDIKNKPTSDLVDVSCVVLSPLLVARLGPSEARSRATWWSYRCWFPTLPHPHPPLVGVFMSGGTELV